MSVCGQTEEESASEEAGPREAYEQQKAVSTVVRVLTVLAYLLAVSLAAILLSVYYVCVWRSPELPPLNATEEVAARRASPYHAMLASDNGGGGVSMNDSVSPPDPGSSDGATTEPPFTPHLNGTDGARVDNSSVT